MNPTQDCAIPRRRPSFLRLPAFDIDDFGVAQLLVLLHASVLESGLVFTQLVRRVGGRAGELQQGKGGGSAGEYVNVEAQYRFTDQ